MAAELPILKDAQLRRLAELIYRQEAQAIQNIQFGSEPERVKYLRTSRSNYEAALALLDAGADLVKGESVAAADKDDRRSSTARDVYDYIVYCVHLALEGISNCTVRSCYLSKIKEHADELITTLREMHPKDVTKIAKMADDAAQYRNEMLEYFRSWQSPASRSFSKYLKQSGKTFEQLVTIYQGELNFAGEFKNLSEAQKLEVYNKIIEKSKRGRPSVNIGARIAGSVGLAVLLFTAGVMVWDIFSSEHEIPKAVHDVVVTTASVGGAMLGQLIGTTLARNVLVGVQAMELFVALTGLITGILGAFIIGEFAGWLIDLIIGSASSVPFSTDGLKCYVAPMPDGIALARQILHQEELKTSEKYV
ncbi:uncharacterized protein LOC131152344 [Malania oleifera]|uniref:uncharacterized protein LOC131152344 n=1 Tax=Malania oleifera TaxID=397392 RepID=UPI0025AE39DD|nr:uncharacterized protein LOC131152344 [Malania oleifera]